MCGPRRLRKVTQRLSDAAFDRRMMTLTVNWTAHETAPDPSVPLSLVPDFPQAVKDAADLARSR
jgi:hypothetical protein